MIPLVALVYLIIFQDSVPDKPQSVSIIQLVSDPNSFSQKKIVVFGYINIEHEGNALFLHREHAEYWIIENAIWINVADIDNKLYLKMKALSGNYVCLRGYFDANYKGYPSNFCGTLTKVDYVELLKKRVGN